MMKGETKLASTCNTISLDERNRAAQYEEKAENMFSPIRRDLTMNWLVHFSPIETNIGDDYMYPKHGL